MALSPVLDRDHVVSETGQHLGAERSDGFLIVHQENGFASAGKSPFSRFLRRKSACFGDAQIDVERGTPFRIAVTGNVSSMVANDAVNHGKPQSRAFAGALGRVERLEQVRLRFRGHSLARVAYPESHIGTRFKNRVPGGRNPRPTEHSAFR